jgi:hypothetical protein
MMMEKLVERLAGKTEVLGENLPQCRFIHHKPHICPGANLGRRGGKPATNRLSYGTAFHSIYTGYEAHLALMQQASRGFFPWDSGRVVKLTTHLH